MTGRRWLVVLMTVTGCAKAPPPKKVEPKPPPDPHALVRETVKFIYSTLETGDPDPIASKLSPDVMAFGLAPSDTFSQRDPLLNGLRQHLLGIGLGTATLRIRTGRIDVGVSADGRAAWFWDLPRVEWETKSTTTTWLARVTGHAVRLEDHWEIDAVHVSLAVPDERLFAKDAEKKFLPPLDVVPERGPDTDQIIGLSRRVLDDVGVKFERVSARQEVVIIGTSAAEVFETGLHFKELVRPHLPALKKAAISYRLDGPIRARLSPSGTTGWVAANVVLRQGTGKKAVTAPPFRVLWVFALEGGLWNLVIEHQSLALKEELRIPATPDELASFERLDAERRRRTDPRSQVVGGSLPERPSGPPPDGGLAAFD